MKAPVTSYYHRSRGLLYSYLFCLPVLFLYEILILATQPGTNQIVRVSVDVWFKQLFNVAGFHTLWATFLIVVIAGAVILIKKRDELRYLNKTTFFFMVLESVVYAILIGLFIQLFLSVFLSMNVNQGINSLPKLQLYALSLGAGIYEELFFRVILVSFLIWIFSFFLKEKMWIQTFSIIIAALLFSGVHYVGSFGDPFELYSFLFRFLFGLAMNLIYVKRGFGIAVWTHALYDIIVVSTM